MSSKELQIINDEIITYKKSIEEIKDKINLLDFLDSVDNSLKKTLNLDCDELVSKRKYLEQNLRELLDKKVKLVEKNENFDNPVKTVKNDLNSTFTNNYLSILCDLNCDIDTLEYKQDLPQ